LAKTPQVPASRSKIISAIKNEISALANNAAAGAFEKSIYTREGHERGYAHEKGSLVDRLERIKQVLDPAVAKEVSGGVISAVISAKKDS
jgi:hypothetical protein